MIGFYNLKENMIQKLSESLEIKNFTLGDVNFPDKLDGLIIDFANKENYKAWVYQAALIEEYYKKTKILIFDRYFSITSKEYNWLKKFNVIFFEPAINNRKGFEYLPYWIDNIEVDWKDNDKREIHLAYSYKNIEDRLKYFEKYYREYAKLFPDKNVCYSTVVLSDIKRKEYKNDNLNFYKMIDFKNVAYSIVIDSKKNYEIGYLDESIFSILKYGCVPILPIEHKYFHALFGSLVVDGLEDIDYITSGPDIRNAFIDDILINLKNLYPEFLIDNVAEVIINCFK